MSETKALLPYGTYGVLKSSVERFVDSTVPTSLNRHVLDDLSGGDFSALVTTLRFFSLVGTDRSVKQSFRDLVEARKKGEQDYKGLLLTLIEGIYKPIVGNMDMARGTLPDLEKKFKDVGMPQGQMLTKAVRFYVKALEDCGVKVSEHITKPRTRTGKQKPTKKPRTPKPATKSNSHDNNNPPGDLKEAIPTGFERLPIPGLGGAFIQYPANLTQEHCTLFTAMAGVLETYVKSRKKVEGKP